MKFNYEDVDGVKLPGTTFWVKRPLLHAFNCKDCEIITFKYGKDDKIKK